MRTRRGSSTNSRGSRRTNIGVNFFNVLLSIQLVVIGFILMQPYIWYFLLKAGTALYVFCDYVGVLALLIGAPMFVAGIFGLCVGGRFTSGETTSQDVGRIRHAVETQKMEKK